MKINKDFINNLSIEYFNKDFNSYIDELIKEYLSKNNKLKYGRFKLVSYYINHSLYDMCFKAPAHIETEKILSMIETCSKSYILEKYADEKEKEKQIEETEFA